MVDVARGTPLRSRVHVVLGIELDNMVRAAQQHECAFFPGNNATFELDDRRACSDR